MEMKMGDLVASIGRSMADAQQAIAYHAIENYLNYFHPLSRSGDGALSPETATLMIPSPDGKEAGRSIDVPLVALSQHSNLELENIQIKMYVSAKTDEEGNVTVDLNAPGGNERAAREECRMTEMELSFQRQKPPEGTSRILSQINKAL